MFVMELICMLLCYLQQLIYKFLTKHAINYSHLSKFSGSLKLFFTPEHYPLTVGMGLGTVLHALHIL